MSTSQKKGPLGYALMLVIVLLLAAVIIPTIGRTCVGRGGSRSTDGSHLRQIGQSTLIYAQGHKDQLPQAADVWDYARHLAEGGGLETAAIWQSKTDPATPSSFLNRPTKAQVLAPSQKEGPRKLGLEFRDLKPCWAVPLGRITTNSPATTPIAWTRGLQPDGTWAKHSPYGEAGGFIVFIGGNVAFYKNLKGGDGGELVRFDDTGMTSNILEALPPGTRISEYLPTPEEKVRWSLAPRQLYAPETTRDSSPKIVFAVLWAGFLCVSIYRWEKHRPGALTVLLWPLLITIIFSVLIPTVAS